VRLRAIRLLNLRGLRERPARTSLAVVAVGAGVALVVGVQIASHSVDRSLESFTSTIGGPATLRVEGAVDHGGLDASVLPQVAAAEGVGTAIPLVLTITQAVDGTGEVILIPVIGVDCAIEGVLGDLGCTEDLLSSLGDAPLISKVLRDRLGPDGAIRTDLGSTPIALAAVVDQVEAINGGLVAVYELGAAQRQFARPDGLDAILVVPTPGSDPTELRAAVEAAAGSHNKVVDASSPVGGSMVAGVILPMLFLISLVGLLIGAQLVRNTIELSLEERRRELATASALGAPPRGLLVGVLAEAAVIGGLGGVVGLGLGTLVATAFVDSLSTQVERATGLHIDVAVPQVALAIGVIVGVVVCVGASVLPAWRAGRRELAAELSERGRYELPTETSPGHLTLTAAAFVLTVAVAFIARRDGALDDWQSPALLVSLVVSILLSFRLPAQLSGRLLQRLRGRGSFGTGPTRVALDNLLSTPRRTASVAAAVGAPVVMAVMIGSIVPGIAAGAHGLVDDASSGRVFVSTMGTNNVAGIDAKTPPDLERRIAELPGVADIEHWYYAMVDHPRLASAELDGVDGEVPTYHVYRGADGPSVLAAGQVMIGPQLARDEDLDVGSELTIPGRYGDVTFTVGGIWSAPNGLGRGITATATMMRTVTGPRPPERLQVVPVDGVSATELAARIRDADLDPRLIVMDPDELADDYSDEFTSLASPFWAMQRGILAVALIATASTLLLAAIQRRRELAILAALGMAPADLARSTLIETLLLGLAATLTAALGAQAGLACFTWSSELTTSLVIPYQPRLGGYIVAALMATFVALIGAALPAWRANRADPILALREG